MGNIGYDLKRYIFPQNDNYEFIKSITLLIPYKEIGLEILVRKEITLPFFYEIILKLIDCNWSEVENIANITGVETEIIDDVIGEMSIAELVNVKSKRVYLTPNGRVALEQLKKVTIEKAELNQIYFNAINGQISFENVYTVTPKSLPSLDEEIQIGADFLNQRFAEINEYYSRTQDMELGNNQGLIKNELYQILKTTYDKLCFVENKLYIYLDNEDNTLKFKCDNDESGNYAYTVWKQFQCKPSLRRILKRFSDVDKYISGKLSKDEQRIKNTGNLLSVIRNNKLAPDQQKIEIEKFYFSDRYMFQGEYRDLINTIKNIRLKKLIISSDNISGVIDNNFLLLVRSILSKIEICIIYEKDQKHNNFINNLKKENKNGNIEFIVREEIKETNIILFPYCAVEIIKIPIKVDNDYLIKEEASITFDLKKIEEKMLKLEI